GSALASDRGSGFVSAFASVFASVLGSSVLGSSLSSVFGSSAIFGSELLSSELFGSELFGSDLGSNLGSCLATLASIFSGLVESACGLSCAAAVNDGVVGAGAAATTGAIAGSVA